MNVIDYAAVAAKVRERSPAPDASMPPASYYGALAIHALADALEEVGRDKADPAVGGSIPAVDGEEGDGQP